MKECIMKFLVSKIIIFVGLLSPVNAMESARSTQAGAGLVSIVDCGSVSHYDAQKIGVFGSTPNFKKFFEFCSGVLEGYSIFFKLPVVVCAPNLFVDHADFQKHNREFRQTVASKFGESNVKLLSGRRGSSNDIAVVAELFAQGKGEGVAQLDQLIDMFLHHGIDRKKTIENIRSLLAEVSRHGVTHLMHVFLPSYFAQAGVSGHIVLRFIKRCAVYYQSLYQEVGVPAGMHVILAIPVISLEKGDPFVQCSANSLSDNERYDCMLRVLSDVTRSLFKCSTGTTCFFINHNPVQNQVLCEQFSKKQRVRVENVYLPMDGTNFNVYKDVSGCLLDRNLCRCFLDIFERKSSSF